MNNEKPLSYYTNRLAILFVFLFFGFALYSVFYDESHREKMITLLIATGGAIALLVVTIATPNKQVEWVTMLLNKGKHKE